MKYLSIVLLSTQLVAAGCGWEPASNEAVARSTQELGGTLSIAPIGRYVHGSFDSGAAEISAYDAGTQRLFVINAEIGGIDVLDLGDPTAPALLTQIDLSSYGAGISSVAVHDGTAAVAMQNADKTQRGNAVFLDTSTYVVRGVVQAGFHPDMIAISPNGRFAVVCNEGEPTDDYAADPEGSVTVIRLFNGYPYDPREADFTAFNSNVPPGVRVSGPGATAAQDFEPEYATFSANSRRAWVTLQENNAIATVYLPTATVTRVDALGTKDHSVAGDGLDASNKDDAINIATWPVRGLYMPDAIASYYVGTHAYLVTANEGDSREWGSYADESRIKDITLDPIAFPNAATLQLEENLGRLKIINTEGDTDGDGDYDELYSYGARSFSIWDRWGNLVFDSGDEFEQTLAGLFPANFNATNDENGFDDRSDDKGPEPEGVAVHELYGKVYAFIGIERMSGIMVYDVSTPSAPVFVDYVSTRDFSIEPAEGDAGDLAPEGLLVVSAADSPTGVPLLIASYEVSGTTRVFELTFE